MQNLKLFTRQYKILTTDPDIRDHNKYAKIIEKLNHNFEKLNHNFAGNSKLSETITDIYADTLNYVPTIDLAVEDVGKINAEYEKHIQNSMTITEKANLLKSLARDYFANKTYNVFENIYE